MKKIFFCISLICLPLLAFSYSLTIIVAQKDASQDTVRNTTRAVEGSVMDYFFNAGAIVSNEPIITDTTGPDPFRNEISSAIAGGFDYVLTVLVNYNQDMSTNKDAIQLRDVKSLEWELYRSPDIKTLKTGTLFPPASAQKQVSERDAVSGIKTFCSLLGKEVNSELKK